MRLFTSLFKNNPSLEFQLHKDKVLDAIIKLKALFDTFQSEGFSSQCEELIQDIIQIEGEADRIKFNLRKRLKHYILFQIDRTHFQNMLSLQDDIADIAENIAQQFLHKNLVPHDELLPLIITLLNISINIVEKALVLVEKMELIQESVFGGPPAEAIKEHIDDIAALETDLVNAKHKAQKKIYSLADEKSLSFTDFTLWRHISESISLLANVGEKLSVRISMLLNF